MTFWMTVKFHCHFRHFGNKPLENIMVSKVGLLVWHSTDLCAAYFLWSGCMQYGWKPTSLQFILSQIYPIGFWNSKTHCLPTCRTNAVIGNFFYRIPFFFVAGWTGCGCSNLLSIDRSWKDHCYSVETYSFRASKLYFSLFETPILIVHTSMKSSARESSSKKGVNRCVDAKLLYLLK